MQVVYEVIKLFVLIVVYFLYTPKSYKKIIEGDDFHLNYKLSTNRFPISFLKNGEFIPETTNVTKRIAGLWKTLVITGVTQNDEGKYCLMVERNKSEPVQLSIQRMLYVFVLYIFDKNITGCSKQ